jgi:two-component system nitrogen regulation response regulator NtrX
LKKRILVIDDEEVVLKMIKSILEIMGHEVSAFQDAILGEEEAKKNDYDLIICDLVMPGRTGDEITKNIIMDKPNARILIITGYGNDSRAQEALNSGAISLIGKPFEIAKTLDFLR